MVRHKNWWISCCKRVFVKLVVRGIKVKFKFLGKVILKYTVFLRTQGIMQWELSNFLQMQFDTQHNWSGFSNFPALVFHVSDFGTCLGTQQIVEYYNQTRQSKLCGFWKGRWADNVNKYDELYQDVLDWTVLDCTGLYWTVLDCTKLYWIVLDWTGLYWTVLNCTRLHWAWKLAQVI